MAVLIEGRTPPTTDEHANIELVRSIYRAFLDGDMASIFDSMSPEVRIIGKTTPSAAGGSPSYTGSYEGITQVRSAFEEFRRLVQYQEPLTPARLEAKGNRVLVTGADVRRSRSTGESTETRWTMIWTIEDGQVTELRVVEDNILASEQ